MIAHSSVLAWRIPRMGEPGGLLSMGSHRVGHDWSDLAAAAAAFAVGKLLCLIKSHSFIFGLISFALGDKSKKMWFMSKNVLSTFSSRVLRFQIVNSGLNPFWVYFWIWSEENVLISFFCCNCPVFPAPLIEETVFSPLYIFASFVKNKVPIGAWVYFWAFYLSPLVYILFLRKYHAVLITVAL